MGLVTVLVMTAACSANIMINNTLFNILASPSLGIIRCWPVPANVYLNRLNA